MSDWRSWVNGTPRRNPVSWMGNLTVVHNLISGEIRLYSPKADETESDTTTGKDSNASQEIEPVSFRPNKAMWGRPDIPSCYLSFVFFSSLSLFSLLFSAVPFVLCFVLLFSKRAFHSHSRLEYIPHVNNDRDRIPGG